jgi:hypothetical protein
MMARHRMALICTVIGIIVIYVLAYAPVYSIVIEAHAPEFYRMERLTVFRPVDKLLAYRWMQTWYVKWAEVCGVGGQFRIRCDVHNGTGPTLILGESLAPEYGGCATDGTSGATMPANLKALTNQSNESAAR